MFKAQVQDYTTDIQMKDEISTLGWFSIPEADEKLIYYHHSLNAFLNNKATYYDEGFVDWNVKRGWAKYNILIIHSTFAEANSTEKTLKSNTLKFLVHLRVKSS